MKNLVKVLLVISVIGLAWAVYNSIQVPVNFDKTKVARERAVIKELVDIRTAQVAYKQEHNVHAANFDELRNWLQNGNVKFVSREMELTEKQLESGMTEPKALEIIKKAKSAGNWTEAEKEGLSFIDASGNRKFFSRDTTFMNAKEYLFGKDYDISALGKVPYSNNATFNMDTASVMTSSGFNIKIFEASTTYDTYLGDLNKNELVNLTDKQVKIGKFPGLKVGSLTEINNYAGNWE